MVFSLVIDSAILASSWHIVNWRPGLLLIDMYFLNQNPCVSSLPGVFQFCNFFNVALSDCRCMSTLGSSSSSCNSFSMLFIQSAFRYVLSIPIFYSKVFLLPSHPVVGLYSSVLHLLVWGNFLWLFWNVLFCEYFLTLYRYFLSLLSFAIIFLFNSSCCIVTLVCCFVLVFSYQHIRREGVLLFAVVISLSYSSPNFSSRFSLRVSLEHSDFITDYFRSCID